MDIFGETQVVVGDGEGVLLAVGVGVGVEVSVGVLVGVGVLQLTAQKPFEHLIPDLQLFPWGQKPPISHSVHSSLIHWLQYLMVPSEYWRQRLAWIQPPQKPVYTHELG